MCPTNGLSTERGDTGLRTTFCPECGSIAEIEWSELMISTSGPIELVKIRCILKHWYLMPLAS